MLKIFEELKAPPEDADRPSVLFGAPVGRFGVILERSWGSKSIGLFGALSH